jgi:hypothetical protein
VDPVEQVVGPGLKIRLHGRGFRPFMRLMVTHHDLPIYVGGPLGQDLRYLTTPEIEGRMLIETPTTVEFALPQNLRPGKYDLHLYDQTQELVGLANAFTLTAPPMKESWVSARVRFVAPFDAAVVQAGNVDLRPDSPSADLRMPDVRQAELTKVLLFRKSSGTLDGAGADPFWSIDADVRIPVRQVAAIGMWMYRAQPVQLGSPFSFHTEQYQIHGTIVGLNWKTGDVASHD